VYILHQIRHKWQNAPYYIFFNPLAGFIHFLFLDSWPTCIYPPVFRNENAWKNHREKDVSRDESSLKCLTWLQCVGLTGVRVTLLVGGDHRHRVVLSTLDAGHSAPRAFGPAALWLAVFLRHRGGVELGAGRSGPRDHRDVGEAVHEAGDAGGRAGLCGREEPTVSESRLWNERTRRSL